MDTILETCNTKYLPYRRTLPYSINPVDRQVTTTHPPRYKANSNIRTIARSCTSERKIRRSLVVVLNACGKNQSINRQNNSNLLKIHSRKQCPRTPTVIQIIFDRPPSHNQLTIAMLFRIYKMSK